MRWGDNKNKSGVSKSIKGTCDMEDDHETTSYTIVMSKMHTRKLFSIDGHYQIIRALKKQCKWLSRKQY